MTNEQITALLAERVMGWGVGPDRFFTGNRTWMPRWRFKPAENLEDAFRLLQQAAPKKYSICASDKGAPEVHVIVGGSAGSATGLLLAYTITTAVARAIGIDVPDDSRPTISSGSEVKQSGRHPHGK